MAHTPVQLQSPCSFKGRDKPDHDTLSSAGVKNGTLHSANGCGAYMPLPACQSRMSTIELKLAQCICMTTLTSVLHAPQAPRSLWGSLMGTGSARCAEGSRGFGRPASRTGSASSAVPRQPCPCQQPCLCQWASPASGGQGTAADPHRATAGVRHRASYCPDRLGCSPRG